MNAVLVGADRLGNIPEVLAGMGITIAHHISGRQAGHQRRLPNLPKGTQLLILFTDFLGHNVMRHFRELARNQAVPVIACRRSTVCVVESVQRCLVQQGKLDAGCGGCVPEACTKFRLKQPA
ncbi:MAG: DUF2325 domain-containing protein [Burkholderiales bacterium]|nr:DUF2325 domain-containing protein [Burkholderiales bacterium]